MDCIDRLEQRIETMIARIGEMEAANRNLSERNADLTEEIGRLRSENEQLKLEKNNMLHSYGQRETEVRNRLESILSQVEKIEIEMP